MVVYIESFFADDNVKLYYEIGDDKWATRQVDLQGPDWTPTTAASLEEVTPLIGDIEAMSAYEVKYGVLAEASIEGWQDSTVTETVEITKERFEEIWDAARAHLSGFS